MKLEYDVIIIGAGVAGMSAAIYLKRAGLSTVMIEQESPGGQVNRTSKIENYPGSSDIDGPQLATNIFKQTQDLGVEYRYGNVHVISKENNCFIIETDIDTITSRAVIIATGRKPKSLGVPNEKELSGKGISWCAICDGPLFKGKELIVIGGGNSALEESLHLAEIGDKVTIVHRGKQFKGESYLQSKVLNHPKIEIIFDSQISSFNKKDNKLYSVTVENNETGKNKNIKCEGAFIYIGFEPASDIIKNFNIKNEEGYILVDENQRTSVENLYACGDVIKKETYQIVTATAEGAKAAMSAVKDLNK
jgi:thioredoxin reductase (NADPH)